MGYFSNGTEGMAYEDRYCARCIHGPNAVPEGEGCAVWDAHMLFNYDECNNPESVLHILIPRALSDGTNRQCAMFVREEKR